MMIFGEGRSLEQGFREGQFNYQNFSGEADEITSFLDRTFDVDESYREMISKWGDEVRQSATSGIYFAVVAQAPVDLQEIGKTARMIADGQTSIICQGSLAQRIEIPGAVLSIRNATRRNDSSRTMR